jgi:hypothetical protein
MYSVWNGTAWVSQDQMLLWDGAQWVHREPSYYDGTFGWQPESSLVGNYSIATYATWSVAAPTAPAPPPPPPVKTYTATKSFAATWGASYRSNGSKRTDKTDLYQGYVESFNGNQKSLCGFSVSGIPSNAVCTSATVKLYANHWYNNSGGIAVIGTHNKASEPGSWSGSGTNDHRVRYTWNTKTGSRTINLGTTIGNEFIDGVTKGLMFGPGPSTSVTYYGYFEADGSLRPVITLSYQWTA